jgi:autotransporter-associated beta strand protein
VNGKISSATTAGINFLNSTTSPAGTTAEFQINNTANDFSGGAVIGTSGRNVKVSIKSLGNTGAAGSLGTGSIIIGETGASSTVQTLNYTGAGETSNKTITLRASSNAANRRVIDTTGATGALKLSGSLVANDTSLSTETANVQLSGSGTLGDEVTGVIGNGAGAGKVALIKAGAGTWTLSGNNTYTGTTTVSEGTLALGAANRIADASNLVLSGGTFATGGFGETLGTLSLTANSTIDLGSGASALVFSASNGIAWTSLTTLNIVNFNTGTDSVRIGTSAAGLTETQLSQITINGFEALIDSQGYLSFAAIPEPSTYAVMLGGLALAGVMIRRRRC